MKKLAYALAVATGIAHVATQSVAQNAAAPASPGGPDASACLRGVPDQALAGRPRQQLALIRACVRMAVGARASCYSWLGRTLAVVTNGVFRERGCTRLRSARARTDCSAGAARMYDALVTFS